MELKNKQRIAIVGAGFIGKSVIRSQLAMGNVVSVLDRHICPDEFALKVSWTASNIHNEDSLDQVLHGASIAYYLLASTVPGDQHLILLMRA